MLKKKFTDRILQEPSYRWSDKTGKLVKPSSRQLWKEALSRINIFHGVSNWISFFSAFMLVLMPLFLVSFLIFNFSWLFLGVGIFYALVVMGTHGTIWYHRYCTHKSYRFSHPLWRIITQNLAIRTLPEEIYVVSHHVHHSLSDQPGDPYNPEAGLLYCMLAEFNHQRISPDLSEIDYNKVKYFLKNSGVGTNTFAKYKKWGSVMSPFYTVGMVLINWLIWYTIFYLIGGHSLACALFSAAYLWFIGVRAFNYTGHGKGIAAHKDGVDFDRSNLSINEIQPGLMTGEWHNNHHLFPGSARAGFLKYQLDLAWIYIYCLHKIGMVSSYKDSKKEFLKKFYKPGL